MHYRLITDRDPAACAELQDRGLHYGDGLFETLLLKDHRILYLDEHLSRLQTDSARLGIPCPPLKDLARVLESYRLEERDLVLKLILTRGASERGGRWPEAPEPIVYMMNYPYRPNKQPLAADFSNHSLPENQILSGIKHLNRLDYILASRHLAGQDAFEQLILCDARGRVIETLVHNLFFVRNGRVHTPDLSRCGVNGVMRRQVIKRLEQSGKAVKIGDCSRDDLLGADEAFVCNSVQGIRPLTRIGGQELPVGPLTRTLMDAFDAH